MALKPKLNEPYASERQTILDARDKAYEAYHAEPEILIAAIGNMACSFGSAIKSGAVIARAVLHGAVQFRETDA